MKFLLPQKWLLLLVVILSSIAPMQYALNYFYPEPGTVFRGYGDDILMLTLMKSPSNNFDDPWSFDGGKVWHNPLIGPVYLFIFLGIAPLVLGINLYIAFVFSKLVFALIYYIVVYNLIIEFVKNERHQKIAFILFMLSAGLGGIIYIASFLIFGQTEYLPIIGYAFTREFDELAATAHSLTHVFRLYYVIAETLGYLALLLFMQRRKLYAGITLGLAFLVYPMYGMVFSLILLIYSLAKNYSRFTILIKKTLVNVLPVYAPAAAFLLPWLIPYLSRSYYYNAIRLNYEALPALNMIIGFFLAGTLAAYYLYKRPAGLLKNRKFVLLFGVSLIPFILKGLKFTADTSTLFKNWLMFNNVYSLVSVASDYSLLIEVFVLGLAVALALSFLASKSDIKIKFLLVWLIVFFVLSGIDPSHMGRIFNTIRFAPSLLFPMAVLAAYGLALFSKNFRIKPVLIVMLILLLSLPSLLGYNAWLQRSARMDLNAFFTDDEYDAMVFLKNQSDGIVFSSVRYGAYIPFYTNKNAFIFSAREENFTDAPESELLFMVNRDHDIFYKNTTATVKIREEILNRYNITYVLIGRNEKQIDIPKSFTKIRSGETEIYIRA